MQQVESQLQAEPFIHSFTEDAIWIVVSDVAAMVVREGIVLAS